MTVEAIRVEPVAAWVESATTSLGRSLGRAARLATVWLGAATGSIERVFSRSAAVRVADGPRVRALIDELSLLIRAQPEGDYSALVNDDRFWSLVDQLSAARSQGAPASLKPAAAAVDARVAAAPDARASKPKPAKAAAAADSATAPAAAKKESAARAEPAADAEPNQESAAEPSKGGQSGPADG